METMEVTPHEKEEILQKRERLQKRGDYWLTPEGRAEIRATWDDPEDGAIPLPLLNELVKVEEESRQLKEAGIILLSIGKFTIEGQDHISRCCICRELPEQKHDQGCQFARARTIIESSPICVATEQALAGPEEFENQPGHTGGLLAEEKSHEETNIAFDVPLSVRVEQLEGKLEATWTPEMMQRAGGYPRSALEMLDEIDRLRASVAELEDKLAQAEQVSGEYCEKCIWAMKFPNQPYRCELEAKNKALTAEIKELKGLLEQRFAKRNDETFAEFRGRISAEAWRYSRVQSIDGILESLSRAVELARVLREREAT